MKKYLFFLLIILYVQAAPFAGLFAYSIYLSGKHEFTGSVRLGDIGRIENSVNKESISQKLVVKKLSEPVYVSNKQLSQKLKGNTPEELDRIYGKGVWLIPKNRVYNSQELQSLLFSQMQTLKGSASVLPKLSVQVMGSTRLQLPSRGVALEFRLPAHARSLSPGKRILAMDVFSLKPKKTFLLRRQISVSIKKWIQVAVAKHDLLSGQKIKRSDFRLEKRAVYSGERDFVSTNIIGMKAIVKIGKDSDFTVRNLQHKPTVLKGQRIGLVMQSPGVILKVRTIAQKNGEVGDFIPVRVLLPGGRFGSRLNARIIDKNQVVMESMQ